MGRHLVFVYGTLKTNEPNYEVLLNKSNGLSSLVSKAKTVYKWPLIIASKYNVPFLVYKLNFGQQVVGEIYSVDDQMLHFLDEFEGHPNFYTRLETPVILENGSQCLSWTYFLMNYRPEMLELPYYSDYSSYDDHGLRYVERSQRISNDQRNDFNILTQVQQ